MAQLSRVVSDIFVEQGESAAAVAEAQSAVLDIAKRRGGGSPHIATTPEVTGYSRSLVQVFRSSEVLYARNILYHFLQRGFALNVPP